MHLRKIDNEDSLSDNATNLELLQFDLHISNTNCSASSNIIIGRNKRVSRSETVTRGILTAEHLEHDNTSVATNEPMAKRIQESHLRNQEDNTLQPLQHYKRRH